MPPRAGDSGGVKLLYCTPTFMEYSLNNFVPSPRIELISKPTLTAGRYAG